MRPDRAAPGYTRRPGRGQLGYARCAEKRALGLLAGSGGAGGGGGAALATTRATLQAAKTAFAAQPPATQAATLRTWAAGCPGEPPPASLREARLLLNARNTHDLLTLAVAQAVRARRAARATGRPLAVVDGELANLQDKLSGGHAISDPATAWALRGHLDAQRAAGHRTHCRTCGRFVGGAVDSPTCAHCQGGTCPTCAGQNPAAERLTALRATGGPTFAAGGVPTALDPVGEAHNPVSPPAVVQTTRRLLTSPDPARQDAGARLAQAAILAEVPAYPTAAGPVETGITALQADPTHGPQVRAVLDRNGWVHCGRCGRFIGRPGHSCPQAAQRTPAQALADLAPQHAAAQAGWDQAVAAWATADHDPTTAPATLVARRRAITHARRLTSACDALIAYYQVQLPPAPPPPPPDPVQRALEVLLPQLAQRPARHALIGALDQPDPAIRRRAAAALAGWSDDGAVQTALIAAARDPDPAVRRWALTGLVSPLAASGRAARVIGAAATDPDPTVRATVLPTPRGSRGDWAVTRRLAQATVGALPGLAELGAGRASDPATLTGLGRAAAALAGHPEVAPELRAVAAQWAADPPADLPWPPTAVKLARRLLGLSGVVPCPQCGGWATPEHTCAPVSAADWGAIQTAGATLAPSPPGAAASRPPDPPPVAPPDSLLPAPPDSSLSAPRDLGTARPLAPTEGDSTPVTSRRGIVYAATPGLGLTNSRYRRTAVVEAAICALPPLDDPGFVPAALAAAQNVQQPEPLVYAAQVLSRAGRLRDARPLGAAIAGYAMPILTMQAHQWGLRADETADLIGQFNLRFWERICRPGPADEFLSVHFRADLQGDLRDWRRQRGRHAAHERRFGVWDDGEGGTLSEEETLAAPGDLEAEAVSAAGVRELLAGLPAPERHAIVLTYLAGYAPAARPGVPGVAETLGVSRRTVSNYLHRARQRLGPVATAYLAAQGADRPAPATI